MFTERGCKTKTRKELDVCVCVKLHPQLKGKTAVVRGSGLTRTFDTYMCISAPNPSIDIVQT